MPAKTQRDTTGFESIRSGHFFKAVVSFWEALEGVRHSLLVHFPISALCFRRRPGGTFDGSRGGAQKRFQSGSQLPVFVNQSFFSIAHTKR